MQRSKLHDGSVDRIKDHAKFVIRNREQINRYLNMVLWFCILTGPAIAGGIRAGIFSHAEYEICIFISVYMAVVALVHRFVIKKWPSSVRSGIYFS